MTTSQLFENIPAPCTEARKRLDKRTTFWISEVDIFCVLISISFPHYTNTNNYCVGTWPNTVQSLYPQHYFNNALALCYPHRPHDQLGNRISRRPNPMYRFRHLPELVRFWFPRQGLQCWKAGVSGDVRECKGHHNEWSNVSCPC